MDAGPSAVRSWAMVQRRLIAVLLLAACAAASAGRAQAEPVVGTAQVLSGDRLLVGATWIALYGIDAPEPAQTCRRDNAEWACGAAATRHLSAFAGGKRVACTARSLPDAEGWIAAKCKLEIGLDLAAELATRGLALVHPRGPRDYWPNRNEGRTRGAGLWSGLYVTPWDWRAGRRVLTHIADERGCAVKGKIDARGVKRILMPFDPAYAAEAVDRAAGERWFCTEAEAHAAGWRR